MRDAWWGFFLGVATILWVINSPWSDNSKYRQAIRECERTLPRDQHCKVIGVPSP